MVSLIAALVLGLLVATAKNNSIPPIKETEEFAAKLMLINRELVNFGPEASDASALLRKYATAKIAATWPAEPGPKPKPGDPPPWKLLESFQQSFTRLKPNTDAQRSDATPASRAAVDLEKATWLQAAQESDQLQHPFVIMLILWLFVLFVSFGLFAPRNGLVVAALLVGAPRNLRRRSPDRRYGLAVQGNDRRLASARAAGVGRNEQPLRRRR
jgi:hypothetical protein